MASSKPRLVSTTKAPSSKSKVAARRTTKPRIPVRVQGALTFGLVVSPGADDLVARVEALLHWIGTKARVDLELHEAGTYEELAMDVRKGRIDIAWLPPIVHVRLGGDVVPLGTMLRDGRTTYETALIVRKDSKAKAIANLRGVRAGWVDRWSAAGFVLPRINLALLGIDPRTFFRTETFHGSHRGVVRALMDGACDVAGTYAQADGKGKVKGGAWTEVPGADVRVLTTFGAIPPDVIGARSGLVEEQRDAVRDALRAASDDNDGRRRLREVFGGETFVEDTSKSYESLSRALDMASARGLFG